jgi:serine/threonine protein kinase
MLLDLDNARPPDAPGEPAGRAGYRAPELERGGSVTPACDVFSLAGCLYFALVGDDPPEQPGPLPGRRRRLDASSPLADLLDACRQADPARRPPAAVVHASLRSLGQRQHRAGPSQG